MNIVIVVASLAFLMLMAYRGFSVILFAPIAAMAAVFLTDPSAVAPIFNGLFLDKMANFIKLYFPVFLMGALFGKLIELSGLSRSLVAVILRIAGPDRAMLAIMLVTAIMTYSGVSLFVVVFAAYPFAAEMFRTAGIPKRLLPATIALGAVTFTMDALPGTPQIQNIIPTSFFDTSTWSAPVLGLIGSMFVLSAGLTYLNWRRRQAARAGETYGENHLNEPAAADAASTPSAWLAVFPLVIVVAVNFGLSRALPILLPATIETRFPGMDHPIVTSVNQIAGVWSVEAGLTAGILTILATTFTRVRGKFLEGSQRAIAGATLAALNTAAEYGFGSVIAALPGFMAVKDGLRTISDPLVNEAVTVTTLAGITGSASGGLSIALGAMANQFMAAGDAAGIPREVLHRVASMASGGMDTLPHNGAIITLLAVTGLTHRQAYGHVFVLTAIKTAAVFVVIGVYRLTGLV